MISPRILLSLPLLFLLLSACGGGRSQSGTDLLRENDVRYAVDNGFEPILKELDNLYALRTPEANMQPLFCSEDSAIRLLLNDSVRMAIATRQLTEKEKILVETHNLPLVQSRIGYDAFALIVHRENPDTVINLNEIRGIISGKITKWEQLEMGTKRGDLSLVFDASGSSTVRYMKDTLNAGKPLGGRVYAQGSNQAVIEAVKSNPDIIGVISTDWLRVQKGDTTVLEHFRDLDVRVMLVGKIGKAATDWQRPYQYYIATGEYPLIRSVWAICTDPRTRSTMKGYYFFLKDNIAQRVIARSSQLLPRTQVQVRDVSIK